MKLSELPPDIQVLILSHLDFPSLVHLVSTHSSFNSVWNSYPEHLSRAICIRNGLADSKTVGSAAPLQAEGWHEKGGLDKEPTEDELREVIREQRSMTGAFDGVTSWKEYAKMRLQKDHRFKQGPRAATMIRFDTTILPEWAAFSGFWKFKVDPVSKWCIATGIGGGVFAFDQTGQPVWYSLVPLRTQPHIELGYDKSISYVSVDLNSESFLIWRFHDSLDDSPPPPPASDLPPVVHAQLANNIHFLDASRPTRGFHPHCWLQAPSRVQATKLRLPYLVAASEDSETISIWNVEDPQAPRIDVNIGEYFLDELNERQVSYLDFDEENLFVGGDKSIVVFKPFSPQAANIMTERTTWPPTGPDDRLPRALPDRTSHYRQQTRSKKWTAVHHDSKSNHLFASATSRSGEESTLLWTCDYRRTIWSDDSSEDEEKTVVLSIDCDWIEQLSVENDRVTFIAASRERGQALISIPLRSFTSLDDFCSDIPLPVCLDYPLPLLGDASNLESSSTETFVPMNSGFTEDRLILGLPAALRTFRSKWRRLNRTQPFAMEWETINGGSLKTVESRFTRPEEEELGDAWVDLKRLVAQALPDSETTDGLMRY